MLKAIRELVGFIIGLFGIICCMCESEYQFRTMFLGIVLLLTGVLICIAGEEKEHGTN